MDNRGVGMIVVWIFVLIAGAMIISIFFMIATEQVKLGSQKLEAQAHQRVESILIGQEASSDTIIKVAVPDEEIVLTCAQAGGTHFSEMRLGGRASDLTDRLLAGRTMQTQELVLFSKELWLPYRVGNVLFVSNDRELLVVQEEDEQYGERFAEYLPEGLKVMIQPTASGQPDAADYSILRAVYVDNDGDQVVVAPDFSITSDDDAYRMVVHPTGSDWMRAGTIRYVESGNALSEPITYNTTAMLLALIWQGDHASAECLQDKIVERTRIGTRLQYDRMGLLRDAALEQGDDVCAGSYNPGTLGDYYDELDSGDWEDAQEHMGYVANKNEALRRGSSCATIY